MDKTLKSLDAENRKSAYVYDGYSRADHNISCSTSYDAYCDYSQPDATSSVGKKVDTGKVVIGLTWSENRNLVSPDQAWLQQVLLQPKSQPTARLHEKVLWLLYAVAVLVIAVTL